jgi:crotonobetainyl-CoA:carnitine CoA-transferase CaiB-like acyl-CoA transferase
MNGTPLALDDLRVVDLTHYLAGPFSTKLLADQGAEVIKIERPGIGDGARRLGPFPNDRPDPERSGHFLYLNAGKLSVTLNLKTASGADLLRHMVEDADVLVDNFRPGTLERLGLGHEALSLINPRLITCSITNFGETGPYRDYVADELVLKALGGLVYSCGDPEREPIGIPFPIAQYIAGVYAYDAILAAEWMRETTGRGEHVDVSIMESILAPQEPMITQFVYSGTYWQRVGYRRKNLYPGTILPCKDGYVAVLVVTAAEWKNLCGMIGRPELPQDPRFSTPQARVANADTIDDMLLDFFRTRSARDVYAQAQRSGVPFALVATPPDLLGSEHLRVRDYYRTITDPTGGDWRVPGMAFKLSDSPARPRAVAPRLGQHNRMILGERLGLSSLELVALTAAGVV